MLAYTLVVAGPTAEDATSWLLVNVDTEALVLQESWPSAFLGHWIFRLEGRLDPYDQSAFEGSLNYEMNDQGSDLVWWSSRHISKREAA